VKFSEVYSEIKSVKYVSVYKIWTKTNRNRNWWRQIGSSGFWNLCGRCYVICVVIFAALCCCLVWWELKLEFKSNRFVLIYPIFILRCFLLKEIEGRWDVIDIETYFSFVFAFDFAFYFLYRNFWLLLV